MSTTTAITDVAKALEDLPNITSTIAAAQATMSADQHASFVQKSLDLLNVAGNSATALANSGTVGNADATHIKEAVAAVNSGESLFAPFAAFIAGVKKIFGW